MSNILPFPPIKTRRAVWRIRDMLRGRADAAGHLAILIAGDQMTQHQAQRQCTEMVHNFSDELEAAIMILRDALRENGHE